MLTKLSGKPKDVFQSKDLLEKLKLIEESSIQDILTPVIQTLKEVVKNTSEKFKFCNEADEDMMCLFKIVNLMELTKIHFEFTLEALATNSEKEIETLKEKYSLISESYEKLKSKEDLTPVPVKYAAVMMYDKIILHIKKILDKCFKKNRAGQIQLVNREDNIAKIKIMTGRLDLCYIRYPTVIMTPKDDIFIHEKSSEVWQELYAVSTFKELITEKDVYQSSRLFHFFVYFSHMIIKSQIKNKNNHYIKAMLALVQDLAGYTIQFYKIEMHALHYLLKPDVNEVFKAWDVHEHPLLCKFFIITAPSIAYDRRVFIPRLFPIITKEVILKEYENKTLNKICPMDPKEVEAPNLENNKYEVLEELFVEQEQKVPVRILSYENVPFKQPNSIIQDIVDKAKAIIPGLGSRDIESPGEERAIVIHMHGGGFVAMTSATHRIYLQRWVKNLRMIHFSIDYRNAPKNKYPEPLDDVWQAYLWITNYAEKILGIKSQKVILVGDSSGATLAVALSLRLIRAGLKPPHGLMLIYPALRVDPSAPSPSYFEALDDTLLPYSLLQLIVEAYVEKEFDYQNDPFISPLAASEELLAKLPPIRIATGNRDPLYDDNWRFLQKMMKLNKNIKMNIHAHLSHGYLCHKYLKNHGVFLDEVCELIEELVAIEN